jgi:hypothetical protein
MGIIWSKYSGTNSNYELNMKYVEFEQIISTPRMGKYLVACNGNSKKAMTLYRKNLWLSQELFILISCFEVALRNKINEVYLQYHNSQWLLNSTLSNGFFNTPNCINTKNLIIKAHRKLGHNYAHNKLLAEMDFGFWRYLFASPQFNAGGKVLLKAFPAKPTSTQAIQYNHSYVFNELGYINELRNRIAHHEPICFLPGKAIKNTTYARQHYNLIIQLFQWMQINEAALLYGLDHINTICNEIDSL